MNPEEARVREEQAALDYARACVAVMEAERALQQAIEARRATAERHTLATVERIKSQGRAGAMATEEVRR